MAIPKYNELYFPVLKALSDGNIRTLREIADKVAPRVGVTPEERQQELLSNGTPVYHDRVSWACTYLKKAQLIENTKRGSYRLTDEGKQVFLNPPAVLDNRFLCRFPSFQAFYRRKAAESDFSQISLETHQFPSF